MRSIVITFAMILCLSSRAFAEYFELRIYRVAGEPEDARVEKYLQHALLPALHRLDINRVGVFKAAEMDTVNTNRIYVLIPHATLADYEKANDALTKDMQYAADGKDFLTAAFDASPFVRMETIVLRGFRLAPDLVVPGLAAPKVDRIYELRSYESATEGLFHKKVEMFNEGGEMALFSKLNFTAVFYAEVLSGSTMPNLMYMTVYENKADRDAHWKTFVDAPGWKELSGKPEYQHTVSKANVYLLRGVAYSDI